MTRVAVVGMGVFHPFSVLVCAALFPFVATAAHIGGIVRDADGNPVQNAQVWLAQDWEVRLAETGADGRYVFDRVGVALSYVCVLKSGHAVAGYSGFVVGSAQLDFQLSHPVPIDLKVQDRDFKPVPGARLRMLVVNDTFTIPVDELLEHGFPPLRANDDGELRIPFVPEGGFVKFTVSHHEYRDALVSYLPPRDKPQQILMYPGVRVDGRVTHSGKGVAQARILIYTLGSGGQNLHAQAKSDETGIYGLRLEPGNYHMAVRHPDYASPRPIELEVPRQEWDAKPLTLSHEMRTPFNISGSVVYPDAKGCGGALIQYRHEGVIYEETFSDNDGIFHMRIPEKTGELAIVPPPGYKTATLPVIPLDLVEDKRDIKISAITVEPLPEISGVVLGVDGKPVADTLITVSNFYIPLWVRTAQDGSFGVTLQEVVEEAVAVRFEHAFRFQRLEMIVGLDTPALGNVQLVEFKPDQEQRDPIPGMNDLSGLVGKSAPDLACSKWFNAEKPVSLRNLRGKVVVLSFWAGFDTSPAGISRIRELNQLHALYENEGDVVFVAVHDATSVAEEVEEYIKNFGITFPVGLDEEPYVTFERYRANVIPQTVLIDKKGRVQYYQVDARLLELIKVLRRR